MASLHMTLAAGGALNTNSVIHSILLFIGIYGSPDPTTAATSVTELLTDDYDLLKFSFWPLDDLYVAVATWPRQASRHRDWSGPPR